MTAMRTWSFAERHPTVPGPWADEPDKAQWIDEGTGLDCLAVRNHMGAWCGYVGLPPEHPLHGAGCEEAESRVPDLGVHGGLTFAGACMTDDREMGVCHVPEPGRPEDVWWLGFDCAHCFDLIPRFYEPPISDVRTPGLHPAEVYRDLDYVRAEVAALALQLSRTESPLGAQPC